MAGCLVGCCRRPVRSSVVPRAGRGRPASASHGSGDHRGQPPVVLRPRCVGAVGRPPVEFRRQGRVPRELEDPVRLACARDDSARSGPPSACPRVRWIKPPKSCEPMSCSRIYPEGTRSRGRFARRWPHRRWASERGHRGADRAHRAGRYRPAFSHPALVCRGRSDRPSSVSARRSIQRTTEAPAASVGGGSPTR